MKMQSRLNHKKHRLPKRLLALLLWLALIAMIVYFGSGVLYEPLAAAAAPLWKGRLWALEQGRELLGYFRLKGNLIEENQRLEEENEELERLRSWSRLILQENRELKELLGRHRSESQLVLAAILSRPPLSPFDTLIIDAGTREGVRVGDLVLASPASALGRIIEVGGRQSKVLLFSSSGGETPVLVGTSTIAARALGRGGQNFLIELPQEIKVGLGDLVYLAGSDLYLLGEISVVKESPAEPFQTLFFSSSANIQQLRWLLVQKQEE